MCSEGWWETKYWLSDMLHAHWGVVMKLLYLECLGAYIYRHTVLLQISHWKGFYFLSISCLRTRGIVLNRASDQKQCRMSSSKLLSHLLYLHCSFPREPCLLWQEARGLLYLMLYGITAVIWDICFCRWTWDGEIDWRRFKSSCGVWGAREDQFNTSLSYNTPYLQCFLLNALLI